MVVFPCYTVSPYYFSILSIVCVYINPNLPLYSSSLPQSFLIVLPRTRSETLDKLFSPLGYNFSIYKGGSSDLTRPLQISVPSTLNWEE